VNGEELLSNDLERFTNEPAIYAWTCAGGVHSDFYQVEAKKLPAQAGGHTICVRTSNLLVISTATASYCGEVRGAEFVEAILRGSGQPRITGPRENADRWKSGVGAVLS
jgi:hypothetical protein